MGSPVPIKNAVDAWGDEATGRTRPNTAKLHVRGGVGTGRYAWLYFNKIWPEENIRIVSAYLQVYNVDAISISTTLNAYLLTGKWDVDKVRYPGPAVGSFASVTKATAVAGEQWNINVTSLLQTAVNSGAWFGFRLTQSTTTSRTWHASESTTGRLRPTLVVEWAEIPDEPTDLTPSGGLAVSLAKPVLTYDYSDAMGDMILGSHQLQFGASTSALDAGTTTYDSGEVATSAPEFDTTLAAYSGWAGLADLALTAWRCRVRDVTSGEWSPWADSVLFQRYTKGVLTITGDIATSLREGAPFVQWTFTGRTQEAYQVAVAYSDATDDWIWDSGRVVSTDTSFVIPFGVIVDTTRTYTVIVRIWDTVNRVSTPGDRAYVEAKTVALTATYDATVTNITSLAMASDPLLPRAILTFSRATAPDTFQVLRSDDNASWQFYMEVEAADALVSGTNYQIIDPGAPSYKTWYWKVVPVSTGHRMGTGMVVSGTVRRLAPFLYRPDGTDACVFLNPQRERGFTDVQAIHTPVGGDNVMVTQRLGKKTGRVRGRFITDALSGVTADEMLKRFLRLRRDSGMPMMVATANETVTAVALNFWYDILTDTSGITYDAAFDWMEI